MSTNCGFARSVLSQPGRGLYIGKYIPPGGKISADVIWGEIWKREEKLGENVKEKWRKWERKWKKGERKEKKKMRSKRIK
jgi:hypothetical protein